MNGLTVTSVLATQLELLALTIELLVNNTGKVVNGSNVGSMISYAAIVVNGEILVDGGSFGANGFHLPFDPEATGVNTHTTFNNGTDYRWFDGLVTT